MDNKYYIVRAKDAGVFFWTNRKYTSRSLMMGKSTRKFLRTGKMICYR